VVTRYKNVPIIACSVIFILFLCGFNFSNIHIPSKQQIRKELKSEIDKLKALSPQARKKKLWLKKKLEAIKAIKQAKLYGAQKYASELYQKSKEYFDLAIEYAKKQQYLKASYLAKECKKLALMASDKAEKQRLTLKQETKAELLKFKSKIDRLVKSLQSDKTLQREKANIILYYQNLIHALNLEQFGYVKKGLIKLKKKLDSLYEKKTKTNTQGRH